MSIGTWEWASLRLRSHPIGSCIDRRSGSTHRVEHEQETLCVCVPDLIRSIRVDELSSVLDVVQKGKCGLPRPG